MWNKLAGMGMALGGAGSSLGRAAGGMSMAYGGIGRTGRRVMGGALGGAALGGYTGSDNGFGGFMGGMAGGALGGAAMGYGGRGLNAKVLRGARGLRSAGRLASNTGGGGMVGAMGRLGGMSNKAIRSNSRYAAMGLAGLGTAAAAQLGTSALSSNRAL